MKKNKKSALIVLSAILFILIAANLIILDNLNSRVHDLEAKTNNMTDIYKHLNSLSEQIDNLETK